MNYEAVIGLEIHVETKTNSKMFSSSPNAFSKEPNTLVTPIDLGMPGTMPTVNKKAVINAIRMCHALHLDIDHEIWFDRKNYFYSDLPKGYQITQDKRPIGKDGFLDINVNGVSKRVDIERLHMEEDTCKQLHFFDFSLLDYNRAGVPLCEIVTRPVLSNGLETMKFLEKIRSIVTYLDVSDGKMEEGSLRCDVNISLKPVGSIVFGTKVEIKNLNSIANVEKALTYEIARQSALLDKGEKVIQETRRFDESKKETVLMRVKTDAVDYKYFTEPNITPIRLSEEFINEAINSSNELPDVKMNRYVNDFKLSEYDSEVLLANKENALYFDEVVKFTNAYKVAINFINGEVTSYKNAGNKYSLSPEHFASLISAMASGKISNKQAREVLKEVASENLDPNKVISSMGLEQISDESSLVKMINDILDQNPNIVSDYKAGKDRAAGFVIGRIMKETQGKANPALTNKLLLEELKRR